MATIYDIAKKFNVSPATVSLSINDDNRVNNETKRRIQEYAKEINYRRNEMARNLRTKRGTIIGVLVHSNCSPSWAMALQGIESEIMPKGYGLLMCNTHNEIEKEKFYIERLLDRRVDGIILRPADAHHEQAARLRDEGVPVVLLDRTEQPGISTVKGDDYSIGQDIAKALIAAGRKNILYFHPDHPSNLGSIDRLRGFSEIIKEAGLWREENVMRTKFNRIGTSELVRLPQGFFEENPQALKADAAFVPEDVCSLALIKGLSERGRKCPKDVSIISWGNRETICELSAPSITSIENPWEDIGRQAAQALMKQIKGQKKQQNILLKEKMIFRESFPHA